MNIKTKSNQKKKPSRIRHRKYVKPATPYPYFGGKSKIAPDVWGYFGEDCRNYIEPFFGGGAVLLARPGIIKGVETVNDMNGFICNFWRALQAEPDVVAGYADCPVNELDHMAKNEYLKSIRGELWKQLADDPEFYNAKIAGWWVWGQSASIGLTYGLGKESLGSRSRVHLGGGKGVHRSGLHLGDLGKGVHRSGLLIGNLGEGIHRSQLKNLHGYLKRLANRVRRVRVQCGDWKRNVTDTVLRVGNPCAIFLDPPYDNDEALYEMDKPQGNSVASDVYEWAIKNGRNPDYRIILCGYDLKVPDGWRVHNWKAKKGYQGEENSKRKSETLLISPYCLSVKNT